MMLKTLAVLCFVAVVSALPVEDIKAPIKESSEPALAVTHGPVLVHGPADPGLVAAPGPVLGVTPGPALDPALDPALVPQKNAPKGESDLKTDATHWGYYRYPYNYGPSVYSYNRPTYYSYWHSYW